MSIDSRSSNNTQHWVLPQEQIFFERVEDNNDYSLLNRAFIQDTSISLDAKGYYGSYVAGGTPWDEIPFQYQLEMSDWIRKNGGEL